MDDLNERLIVVRPASEVTLKSKRTRARFMRSLKSAVQDALQRNGVRCRVQRQPNRLLVNITEGPQEAAEEALGRVFGVGTFSPLRVVCEADPEVIAERGAAAFKDEIRGQSFAVRSKRSGRHPFSSVDVARALGAALRPYGPVDLDDPQYEVRVEVVNERAYIFQERLPGAGGLPPGTEGRVMSLLSGGFDSAVSSWQILRRGVEMDFVLFNLAGGAYERLVTQVAQVIVDRWGYGLRPSLFVGDFNDVLADLRLNARDDYSQVLLKRLMMRAASQLALKRGADALVTGEAIGQVSSQTLPNLRVIEDASNLPILRPLIGTDKTEIIAAAQKVGTESLSARVKEYCAISTGRPVVAADPVIAREQEALLDASLLERAVAEAKELKLRSLSPADLMLPYLFVDSVPEGATVIDCQVPGEGAAWRYPGSLQRDPMELLREPSSLDKDGKYVLYCAQGMQSAQVAEVLQQLGYEAYSYRGGTRALQRAVEHPERAEPAPSGG